MQFSVMLAVFGAIAVNAQSVQTIVTDLGTIDTNTKALTTSVNSFTGTIASAEPIIDAESTLATSINKATSDAKAISGVQSAADSATVITAVQNLIPDIEAALTATSGKAADFKTAGITSVVTGDLTQLKSDTDSLGTALLAIADSSVQTQAKCLIAEIDALFTNALAAFGTGSSTAVSSCSAAAAATGSSSAAATGSSSAVATGSSAAATTAVATGTAVVASTQAAATTVAVSSYTGAAAPGSYVSGPMAGVVALLAAWAL